MRIPEIRDPAAYTLLWWPAAALAYLLVIHVVPWRYRGLWWELVLVLLPWAGMWAYQMPHREQCEQIMARKAKR